MKARAINLLANAAVFASLVFIPNLANDIGATSTQIGLIVGGYAAANLFSYWLFGRASDVLGRRRVLQFGLFISVLSLAFQVFAERSPLVLGIIRILVGLSVGSFPAAIIAYAYEEGDKMGKFSSFGALGWGIGVFLAGLFTVFWGKFLVSSALMAMAFAISLTIKKDISKRMKVPLVPLELLKKNLKVYLVILIRHTGASMIWVFFPIYLEVLGASHFLIGITYAVNALGQFIFMPFADRFKSGKLIVAGLVASVLTFASFAIVTDPYQIIPTQIVLALSWSLTYVGGLKDVTESNVERGTASGLLWAAIAGASIIGPLLGGFAADLFGYRYTILLAAAISFLGILVYYGFGLFSPGEKGNIAVS